MVLPKEMHSLLAGAFPDAEIDLADLTPDSHDDYRLRVVSSRFEGKTLPEQHHLVYRALGDVVDRALSAFRLTTYTPADWKRLCRAS
jgi:stress-induced morphogen